MVPDYRIFEVAYGREVPPPLKALYENRELLEMTPVLITFANRLYLLEIQHFRMITELDEEDVLQRRFAFAVSTDGHDMLVDLTESDLPILQRESGDVDRLGLTLVELLGASHRRVTKAG